MSSKTLGKISLLISNLNLCTRILNEHATLSRQRLSSAHFQRKGKWKGNLEEVRKRKDHRREQNVSKRSPALCCSAVPGLQAANPQFKGPSISNVSQECCSVRRMVLLLILKYFLVPNHIVFMQQHEIDDILLCVWICKFYPGLCDSFYVFVF